MEIKKKSRCTKQVHRHSQMYWMRCPLGRRVLRCQSIWKQLHLEDYPVNGLTSFGRAWWRAFLLLPFLVAVGMQQASWAGPWCLHPLQRGRNWGFQLQLRQTWQKSSSKSHRETWGAPLGLKNLFRQSTSWSFAGWGQKQQHQTAAGSSLGAVALALQPLSCVNSLPADTRCGAFADHNLVICHSCFTLEYLSLLMLKIFRKNMFSSPYFYSKKLPPVL